MQGALDVNSLICYCQIQNLFAIAENREMPVLLSRSASSRGEKCQISHREVPVHYYVVMKTDW